MSPWEFAIGQVVGYRPLGPKWRGRITALERGGKSIYAVIPIADREGRPIVYDRPPSSATPVIDEGNYYIIENTVQKTDPWIAARLDHEDIKPSGNEKGL